MLTRIRYSLFLILAAASILSSQQLKEVERLKLHPSFQMLLEENGIESMHLDKMVIQTGTTQTGIPLYEAIIHTTQPDALRILGVQIGSVWNTFVTARLTADQMRGAVKQQNVSSIDPGSINYPQLDLSVPEIGVALLHSGFVNKTPYKGKGVIVVIYDSGIDWRHLDFRNPLDTTKSRILFIWDQTISPTGNENSPSPFSYGVEYTQQQIENELDGTPTGFVREKDTNGHGTHVAGIAVSNGLAAKGNFTGVAPEADIIAVKGGDGSFSESRMIDGLDYARQKSQQLGKPVVLNWSIGGHSGPHDGTRDYEQAVNTFVQTPGRVVAISAGNDGDNPIHIGGTIPAAGSTTFDVNVPSYTPTSGLDNDSFWLEVCFDNNINVSVSLTSPSGISYTRLADQSGTAPSTTDGTMTLNNRIYSFSGRRYLQVIVSENNSNVPKSGTWKITVTNNSSSLQKYDGWLVKDVVGTQSVSVAGGNTNLTIGMPGTSEGAITVANYVTKWSWPTFAWGGRTYSTTTNRTSNIASSSSIGPTRDGRQKPDIAAPGQGIASALSSSVDTSGIPTTLYPDQKHYLSQGTSMASPHVAGAAALLLGAKPALTAAQIKSLLISTVNTDNFTGATPNPIWGYGKMDVFKAMVRAINANAVAGRTILAYEVDGTNSTTTLDNSKKFAVRFTPATSGSLVGLYLNITTQNITPILGTGPLACEVYSNKPGSVAGIPNSKLGSTVNHPFAKLSAGVNNYIDLTGTNVNVVANTDYHIVVSTPTSGDRLILRTDAGLAVTNRSSIFTSNNWINFSDPASSLALPANMANLRLRPVIAAVTGLVAVEQVEGIPLVYELSQNYPNPFNPSTKIIYSIPTSGMVNIRVFDMLGREVATLINELQEAGRYSVSWNGKANNGISAASGVYFYRFEANGYHSTQKMILMR
ncbi:MAG: S8 family peptidase [bacterium]